MVQPRFRFPPQARHEPPVIRCRQQAEFVEAQHVEIVVVNWPVHPLPLRQFVGGQRTEGGCERGQRPARRPLLRQVFDEAAAAFVELVLGFRATSSGRVVASRSSLAAR